ncbi:MAG: hypothetical protein MJ171_06805, partial [Clostridia bacterium]|nr:hypothetical protein [Clostridia bacterium]
ADCSFYTEANGTLRWLTNTIPAGKMPRVGSYRLSVGGTDAYKVHEALLAGNVDGVGDVNPVFRQPVRYGEDGGEAGYQTIFVIGQEPFTDVLFGATTHLTKEYIVKLPTKWRHVNGCKRIESLTYFCEDKKTWDDAEANLTKVYNAMKDVTDKEHCLNTANIVDKASYEEEFGVACPEAGHFPVCAVTFSGAVFNYIEEQSDDWGYNHFRKDGKLYVDMRNDLGLFFIFEE